MGWEEQLFALFDDLESQAEGLFHAERELEIEDCGQTEYQQVTLASRLMASLDEDIEATETTVLRAAPWLRLAHLAERLAAAKYAPDAFRTELKEAHAELVERYAGGETSRELSQAEAATELLKGTGLTIVDATRHVFASRRR